MMCHEGFLRSARGLDVELRGLARESVSVFSNAEQGAAGEAFTVTLVGHSLGAGVASLLALLWRDEFRGLKCYAYGCPCVGSPALCKALEPHVTSILHGDDLVPRLSIGSCDDLRDSVLRVARTQGGGASLVMSGTAREAHIRMNDIRATCRTPANKLYPPGRLVYLAGSGATTSVATTGAVVEDRQWADFDEMIVSWRMLSDHLPGAYQQALERALGESELLHASHL